MPESTPAKDDHQDETMQAANTTRSNKTSLERKLELLEARFTQPSQSSPDEAATLVFTSPNASSHSFAFDTPSLSAPASRDAKIVQSKLEELAKATDRHLEKIKTHRTVVQESPPPPAPDKQPDQAKVNERQDGLREDIQDSKLNTVAHSDHNPLSIAGVSLLFF